MKGCNAVKKAKNLVKVISLPNTSTWEYDSYKPTNIQFLYN